MTGHDTMRNPRGTANWRPRLGPRPLTGMGTAAAAALAVLTAGVLLLALGAPKVALASRTDALRSLLASASPLAQGLPERAARLDHIEKALGRIENRLDYMLTPRRRPQRHHLGRHWLTLALVLAASLGVAA